MLDLLDDDYMPPMRPWWNRLSRRFMDWLWHGPLTRDLHPPPTPSQLSQALALLVDLGRAGRVLVLPSSDSAASIRWHRAPDPTPPLPSGRRRYKCGASL